MSRKAFYSLNSFTNSPKIKWCEYYSTLFQVQGTDVFFSLQKSVPKVQTEPFLWASLNYCIHRPFTSGFCILLELLFGFRFFLIPPFPLVLNWPQYSQSCGLQKELKMDQAIIFATNSWPSFSLEDLAKQTRVVSNSFFSNGVNCIYLMIHRPQLKIQGFTLPSICHESLTTKYEKLTHRLRIWPSCYSYTSSYFSNGKNPTHLICG